MPACNHLMQTILLNLPYAWLAMSDRHHVPLCHDDSCCRDASPICCAQERALWLAQSLPITSRGLNL